VSEEFPIYRAPFGNFVATSISIALVPTPEECRHLVFPHNPADYLWGIQNDGLTIIAGPKQEDSILRMTYDENRECEACNEPLSIASARQKMHGPKCRQKKYRGKNPIRSVCITAAREIDYQTCGGCGTGFPNHEALSAHKQSCKKYRRLAGFIH
jgi:hypothetical protein